MSDEKKANAKKPKTVKKTVAKKKTTAKKKPATVKKKDLKPIKRKLTIEKIERNMKGGAKLFFKEEHDPITVTTQKYRAGDTYRVPVKSKK